MTGKDCFTWHMYKVRRHPMGQRGPGVFVNARLSLDDRTLVSKDEWSIFRYGGHRLGSPTEPSSTQHVTGHGMENWDTGRTQRFVWLCSRIFR